MGNAGNDISLSSKSAKKEIEVIEVEYENCYADNERVVRKNFQVYLSTF